MSMHAAATKSNHNANTSPETSAGDRGIALSPPVIQFHIPSAAFVDLMGRLRKQKKDGKVSDERLFRWNALGKFDGPFEAKDVPGVLARMSEWNDISTSAGGGPLSPGQTHESETLPAYLDHFNAFTYDLPDKSWGTLRFEKRFDRMTEHGWISTNEVLPPDVLKSKKEIVVHMIIAVSEGGDALNCNPHVTVRLKDIQDQVTIISMLNDQKAKTLEMKSLGTAAADASMSIGMSSDRLKEKSGAPEKLGIDPAALQKAFPLEWISGVVQAAKAAQPDKAMKLQLK